MVSCEWHYLDHYCIQLLEIHSPLTTNNSQEMSKKKFVLRLDDEVYDALEQWAADEFRSANGQIEWILTHQLKLNGRYKPKHPGLKDKRPDENENAS